MKRDTIDETHATKGSHCSVEVQAEPLEHDLDEAELGEKPAEAIREAIAEGIKAIREKASPATIARRKAARSALARGEAWAVERYRGRQPGASDRLFNDSGTLAAGLTVEKLSDGSYAVLTPANRGDNPQAFDGAQMASMQERLVELVPALQDPTRDPRVQAAIEASAERAIRKGR